MLLLTFSVFAVLCFYTFNDFPGNLEEIVCAFGLKVSTLTTLP